MSAKYTYLLIDLGAFAIPFLFSFHPRLMFQKQWYAFWPANSISAFLFLIWDVAYTNMGVWGFNDNYIIGIKLFNLPIEEVLFFICIPYASIFTYHCLKLFFEKNSSEVISRYVSASLIILLLTVGVIFISKLYTGFTFVLLAIFIFFLSAIKKKTWLSHFYFTYTIILLPFFIVNGILTGTGIEEPIVWYNDSENLGIRMLTIPVEDVFYGMLLLLLNTFIFEAFQKKNA
jgi:lycopene cyclase domain-containing protein